MRPTAPVLLTMMAVLAACAPSAPKGVNTDALDEAVGDAIGTVGTCVIVVDKATKKTVWRLGTHVTCGRVLPSCEGTATRTVEDLAEQVAADGKEVTASCPSVADGSRNVGWAGGVAGDPAKGLVYGAAMEAGERALPGREVKLRVEGAFRKAGL